MRADPDRADADADAEHSTDPGRMLPDSLSDIHAITDRLLLECGEFDAIEFLLRRGWLDYADQLAWRRGERDSLQSALNLPLTEVIAKLEAAIRYAKSQGLQRELRPALRAPGSGVALITGSDPHFALLCSGLLRPPATRGQSDLFQDNAAAFELDALQLALAEHRLDAATGQLQRLQQRGQRDVEAYGRLIAAVDSQSPVELRITEIEQRLAPEARRLLKARARDYLALLWIDIAGTLDGQAFDAVQPQRHASHAWMQAGHWRQAAASITGEGEHWVDQPELLARMATIQSRQHRLSEARGLRLQLCWRFPEQAVATLDALAEDEPDRALHRGWRAFNGAELVLPVPLFPAWLLLADPQPRPGWPMDPGPMATDEGHGLTVYRRVRQLLLEPEELAHRRALKALQPELLQAFLAQRERLRV